MRLDFAKNLILFSLAVTGIVWLILFTDIQTTIPFTKANDDCFACHEDKDLTMEVKEKKVSLFVDKAKYEKGVHSGADCKDCHLNYNPDDLPHTSKKSEVDCKSCHGDVKSGEHNSHEKVKCQSCHNPHYSSPAKEIKTTQVEFCTKCHNQKSIKSFKTTAHFQKNVLCSDCHNSGHKVTGVSKNEVTKTCNRCHKGAHEKLDNILNKSMMRDGSANAPVCTDCHGVHKTFSSKLDIQTQACLKCHLDEKKFPGENKGSAKFVATYKTSVHGKLTGKNNKQAATCIDCHGNHELDDPKNPGSATTKANLVQTCSKCHENEVIKYKNSAHGKAFLEGDNNAPSCTKCHGEHDISSVVSSEKFSKINTTDLCLSCHKGGKLTSDTKKDSDSLASNYHLSVHYVALKNGNTNSASCADCHGAHEMKPSDDAASKTNKKNIAATCGTADCHQKQAGQFTGSIHQTAVSKDNKDAPTCINCHGNHQVAKRDSTLDKNVVSKSIVKLCSDCHSSSGIIQRNELRDVTRTFNESFHGLAVRGGSGDAANCESCHGYHNVRSSEDSLSSTFKANLTKTCGQCHKLADKTLFETKIHIVNPQTESPWMYWITRFYILIIFGTIGAMTLHNLLDYLKKKKLKKEENQIESEKQETTEDGKA
ncbi:MAG: cytochrome c3 family protein [Bacteroidetes bacterium]|nr:cytochrome c3 family protein [Bacteroidota bacterium]